MGHLKAKCFNLIIRQYPLNILVDKTVDIVCGITQQIQSMDDYLQVCGNSKYVDKHTCVFPPVCGNSENADKGIGMH